MRLAGIVRAELHRLGIRTIDGETVTKVREGDVITAAGR
jgi:hypothetical protein